MKRLFPCLSQVCYLKSKCKTQIHDKYLQSTINQKLFPNDIKMSSTQVWV